MTPTAISIPIASHVIDGGTIFLILLSLAAIIAACAGLIYLSLWLTKKVNGSRGLVWGALLGVAVVHFPSVLDWLLGSWAHFSVLLASFLKSAVAASALACAINVLSWKLRVKPDASQGPVGAEPDNSN